MNGEFEKNEELLGSVTQLECSSPGATGVPVRSSARVSKKLRLDSLTKPISSITAPDKKGKKLFSISLYLLKTWSK